LSAQPMGVYGLQSPSDQTELNLGLCSNPSVKWRYSA
jgi:hypothetical protein